MHRPVQQQASFKPSDKCFTARRYTSPLFLKCIKRKLLNYTDILLIFVTASQPKLSSNIAINVTEATKSGAGVCMGVPQQGCEQSRAAGVRGESRRCPVRPCPHPCQPALCQPARSPLLLPRLVGEKALHVPEGIIRLAFQATDFWLPVPLQASAIPSPAILSSWGSCWDFFGRSLSVVARQLAAALGHLLLKFWHIHV